MPEGFKGSILQIGKGKCDWATLDRYCEIWIEEVMGPYVEDSRLHDLDMNQSLIGQIGSP